MVAATQGESCWVRDRGKKSEVHLVCCGTWMRSLQIWESLRRFPPTAFP